LFNCQEAAFPGARPTYKLDSWRKQSDIDLCYKASQKQKKAGEAGAAGELPTCSGQLDQLLIKTQFILLSTLVTAV